MPDIISNMNQLEKEKYFICLDLASSYHQILIHSKDRKETAFNLDKGHYEFNRMYFRLKNVSVTFQRLMNRVQKEINRYITFVYLDYIIVISSTLKDHVSQL